MVRAQGRCAAAELDSYPRVRLQFRVGGTEFYGVRAALERQYAHDAKFSPDWSSYDEAAVIRGQVVRFRMSVACKMA
eukprot:3966524-Pleurochrysis_carterae.AAC.3